MVNYKYQIGHTYQCQNGSTIEVLGRNTDIEGCEYLKCSDGIPRYDRSVSSVDAGRVTNPMFYSDPYNLRDLLDPPEKRPYLMYWEEAVDAWVPVPELVDGQLICLPEQLHNGEEIDITFKRVDITWAEFNSLPED